MQTKTRWCLETLLPEIDRLPTDWALLPNGDRKFPLYSDWGKTRYKAADFHSAASVGVLKGCWAFPKKSAPYELPVASCRAIAVLCGEPSDGLLLLDHDGKSCDRLIEELSGLPLGEGLPKTAVVRSGRPGRYQALYRIPERFWGAIATKKLLTGPRDDKGALTPILGDEGKPDQLEFRWTGIQSTILGHHPITGGYQWVYHPQDVPVAEAAEWMIEAMLVERTPEPASPSMGYAGFLATSKSSDRRSSTTKTTWERFDREFSMPWDGVVPLECVLAKVSREALQGQYSKGRNDTGIMLARDLLGAAFALAELGQRFAGDPEQFFFDWCKLVGLDRDTPKGQPQAIWASACKGQPSASLPLGMIENCIKSYAWGQLPDAVVDRSITLSPSSQSSPQSAIASSPDSPTKTPEDLQARIAALVAQDDPFAKAIEESRIAAKYSLSKPKVLELSCYVNRGNRRPLKSMRDVEVEFLDQHYSDKAADHFDTGIATLDALLQGLYPGDLVVLGGRPSMGKSVLAMQAIKHIAQRYSRPALAFSFEMSSVKLMNRLVAAETSIDSNRIQHALYPNDSPEEARVDVARQFLSTLPIYIDDMQRTTIEEIEAIATEKHAEEKLGVLMIDHLGLIHGPSVESRVGQLSDYTRRLKLLAGELGCPIILLSQLNRGVEARTNKRPMNSDLRESGSVEQDADIIVMLYRDEYYNPGSPDRGLAELIVTKNRDGPVGTARALFEPEFTRFKSLAV